MRLKTIATAAALLFGATGAKATLLVYDGFDYTTSGAVDMNGKSSPLTAGNNFGFIAGSSYKAGNANTTNAEPGSLFYAGSFSAGSGVYANAGGKVKSTTGGGSGNFGLGALGNGAAAAGARPYGTSTYETGGTATTAGTVVNGTYFYSFLWSNSTASSTARGYFNVFATVPNTDLTNGSNAYQDGIGIRFSETGNTGGFAVNSLTGGTAPTAGFIPTSSVRYDTAAANTVFLIVGKAVMNGNATTNQIWVNPTTFSTAGGGTVSGGFASAAVTLSAATNPQKMTFGSRPNGGAGNADFYVDEVRVGTSLGDVVTMTSSTISLTASPLAPELATGGNIAVTGSGAGFTSEIDDLTANQNSGSASIAVTPGPLTSTVYAMLWLTGQDATTLESLRSTLDGLANIDAYTGVAGGDEWTSLSSAYNAGGGFSMLVKFTGAAAATPGAVNWNFAAQSGIQVDKIAIVPEPASLTFATLGGMSLFQGRRRRRA